MSSPLKTIPLIETDDRVAKLFKALGHPARLRVVRLLASRGACICGDIVDELPLSQSTVSQHLAVLKEAGIIVGEIQGPAVCYCLAPWALETLGQAIADLSAEADRAVPAQPVGGRK